MLIVILDFKNRHVYFLDLISKKDNLIKFNNYSCLLCNPMYLKIAVFSKSEGDTKPQRQV